ncbi:right-handed parallel beta-helix repeat-containing protein [Halobacterium yunchengense]|uniref:right-handed parallel beta-helix repeat-containing protein n=1 Tax=Halobacterium yunchengense TaxID=3108497 RepID=UPI00300BE05F
MHRRRFLRSVCAVGALATAGCSRTRSDPPTTPSGQTTAPPERPPDPVTEDAPSPPREVADAWGLDDVVNLERAGADPTGEEPVEGVLADAAADGSLVFLPEGRYRITESFALGAGQRFGLYGPAATVVPREGFSDTLFGLGWPEPLTEVYVAGLTFDFTAPETGGRPVFAAADDRVELVDVSVRGEIDVPQDQVRLDVTDSQGTGVVERLSLPDGGVAGTGVTGCEVGDDNHGDVRFVDCRIEGFPDNGLYADPPDGSVTVDGGYFANNGVASVRIETSEASVVRGAHVVVDDADSDFENLRGVRLRAGRSLLVEDCRVDMLAAPGSDGAVTFASELESATVRDCRLHVDADGVNAVRVKSPDGGGTEAGRGPFRCERVAVTGSAAGGAAIEAANTEGCELVDVCVHQPGEDRDGVLAENVRGSLRDVRLAVTGRALALTDSTFDRRNVVLTRPGGGCCGACGGE